MLSYSFTKVEKTEKPIQFSGFGVGVKFRNREDKKNFKSDFKFDTHSERSTDYYGMLYPMC